MRGPKAQKIKEMIMDSCAKNNVPFKKGMYRAAKREYNNFSRQQKEKI